MQPVLALTCLVAGCSALASAPPAPPHSAPEPPPQAASHAPATAAGSEALAAPRQESNSARARRARDPNAAPYDRQTTETLAVVIPREPTRAEAEARARKAFDALKPGERKEVLEWFADECKRFGTFQAGLLAFALDKADREEQDWPALGPLEWFDPELNAPAQPIARTPLAPDAPEVVAVRNQILGAAGSRRLDGGWMYDYAQRTLVRLPNEGDPERVFENGLLGMPPGWDLAEALIERELDDGSLQQDFEGFRHAYTDRWGGVYPGVTLYDAHASRLQLEMPDVDCLGLVHTVLDDWKTWTSIVPPEQHDSLYTKIHELFVKAFRHRSLRTNLARTFLCGTTELRDGYQHNLDNFHALWESASSDPAQLAARLPKPDGWTAFLQGWSDSLGNELEVYYKGLNRRATLDQNSNLVRQKLLWVLDQFQAYQRIETLPPYDGQ